MLAAEVLELSRNDTELNRARAGIGGELQCITDYAIFRWINLLVERAARMGKLPETDWQVFDSPGARVIAHRGFLETQNEFAELVAGIPELAGVEWNEGKCVWALQQYLSKLSGNRQRHLGIYERCLSLLDEKTRGGIQSIAKDFPYLLSVPDHFTLVAIPSWFDDFHLWLEFGVTPYLLQKIPYFLKIDEAGVVLGSKKCRGVRSGERSHDFCLYCAIRSVNLGWSIEEVIIDKGKHEGSHGILDSIIVKMFGDITLLSDVYNIFGEGIPGAIGGDGRDRRQTQVTVSELLENPFGENGVEKAYYAGPKFWESVVQILYKRESVEAEESWAVVMSVLLNVLYKMTNQEIVLENRDINDVAVKLLDMSLARLQITREEVEVVYNSLNAETS